MKYKALICDVDGTLVAGGKDARPTQAVKDVIAKARDTIHIGVATGRPYNFVKEFLQDVGFSSPCILGNGVQIVAPDSGKILKEHTLPQEAIPKILSATKPLGVECIAQERIRREPFDGKYVPEIPYYIFVPPFDETREQLFEDAIARIPNVLLHRMISWHKGKTDHLITHTNATKQHGVLEVSRILGIETDEIIAVGDGYNDFPLLMACGLKVAMGNAVDELKEIADYIAPSVEDDGVADVIERFVLR